MAGETQVTFAGDVRAIGKRRIEAHHAHLKDARILYLFTTANRTKGGRTVLGTAQKANPLVRYLSMEAYNEEEGADFIILVGINQWLLLDEKQQEALVDHELCHCDADFDDDGAPLWKLRGHDVEEFREIIERHGFWKPDLEEFGQVVQQQLALPLSK